MIQLAADLKDVFGTVNPSGFIGSGTLANDPGAGFAKLIGTGINLFVTGAGLLLLLYLFWGALDWINSGGDKEKLSKAQSKITNALIGILLVFGVLVVFVLVAGQILHIVDVTPTGFSIHIPKVNP